MYDSSFDSHGILDWQDSSSKSYWCFFDFKKAFDKVPHERLLTKLKAYGITVNGSESTWSDVTLGVPQSSVLGPIFFVLYITDLPNVLSNPCLVFVNDAKVYGLHGDMIMTYINVDESLLSPDHGLVREVIHICKLLSAMREVRQQYFSQHVITK